MKNKASTLIGSVILITWLSLLFSSLFINEEILLILFLFLTIVIFPFLSSLLKSLLSPKVTEKAEALYTTFIDKLSYLMVLGVFLSFLLFGLGIFINQIYKYLKQGEWYPYSIIDSFKSIGSKWAGSPNDWVGLWEILNFIPLSLVLVILSFIIFEQSVKK